MLKIYFCFIFSFFASMLIANPTHGTETQGVVSFDEREDSLQIQAVGGSRVEWSLFVNEKNESIEIILPDSSDEITLSVEDKVEILGKLHCNGRVSLISKKEIVIGSDAKVECSAIHLEGAKVEHFGSLSALKSNNEGGEVIILGKRIDLHENSLIDASGSRKGGTISIGKVSKDADEDQSNAKIVAVWFGATLKADALSKGDGGDILVWAEKANFFMGTLTAKGKGSKGRGGRAEISSRTFFHFDGAVDLTASSGEAGELTFDPTSITIQSASPDIFGNGSGIDMTTINELDDATTTPTGFPNADSIITAGSVNSLLGSGTTMILAAQSSITVNAAINVVGTPKTLTLQAPSVVLNQSITLPAGSVLDGVGVNTVIIGPSGVIQNGVDIVSPGGTVQLVRGGIPPVAWVQEVYINKNLTLAGENSGGQDLTIIQCPNVALTNQFTGLTTNPSNPVVLVEDLTVSPVTPVEVTIQNLTVDGNNVGFPLNLIMGIGFHNTAGTLLNVHTMNTQNAGPGTGQFGFGIGCLINNSGSYALNILQSKVDTFQKGGMNIRIIAPSNLALNIDSTVVQGYGFPVPLASNGIQLVGAATGGINNCSVTGIQYDNSGAPSESTGLLIFNAGANFSISGNTLDSNDLGAICFNCQAGLLFEGNSCNNNGDIGIAVLDTLGITQLFSNQLSNNGGGLPPIVQPTNTGIYLQGANDELFEVKNNTFVGGPFSVLFVEGDGVNSGAFSVMDGNIFQ